MEMRNSMWPFLITCILVFGCAPFIDSSCPGGCSCNAEIVDCRNANHDRIPWNLPDVTSVREMYLSNNNIVAIVAELREYGNLEVLDLAHNQISLVSNFSFLSSRSLKVLTLANNRLTSIRANTFAGLSSLQTLSLSGNSFTHLDGWVFTALSSLSELDLSASGITSIDSHAFEGLSTLRGLNLSMNLLRTVPTLPLRQVPILETLEMNDNKISALRAHDLSCGVLPKLQALSIQYNQLTSISRRALTAVNCRSRIKYLKLNGNLLREVPTNVIRELTDLHEIDISSNLVRSIDVGAFSDFPELRKISCSYMPQLTVIAKGAFSNLRSLNFLKISHNPKLDDFQEGAVYACPSLRTVLLSENALESIGQFSLPWEQLNHIDIAGNPWKCDCDLQWIKLLLNNNSEVELLTRDLVTCKIPNFLAGKRILDLKASDFRASCNRIDNVVSTSHIALGLSLGVFAVILVIAIAVLYRHRTRLGIAFQKKWALQKRTNLNNEESDDLCCHEDTRSMTPIVLNGNCTCPNHTASS